jgi:hypothetical protein
VSDARPLLRQVSVDAAAEVVLEHAGRRVRGLADVANYADRPTSVAAACLDAVRALTPRAVDLRLEWCRSLSPADGSTPLVLVALVALDVAGVPLRYAGSAVVRDDLDLAAAKTVLDALNRRLGVLGLA